MPFSPLNLGKYRGDKSADGARTGGFRIQYMLQELYARVANLSGLNMVAGPATKLPAGSNPTVSLTGAAPNLTLNLGLPEGSAGAGAPNSPDILALVQQDRLERSLAAAGIVEEPSLIVDFIRDIQFARGGYAGGTIDGLVAALAGSSQARLSTGSYIAADGLRKTAGNNVLRLDHHAITKARLGYLREPSRQNLLTYSGQLDNAAWIKSAVSVIADATAGPDGLTGADKLIVDTATAFHRAVRTITLTNGSSYAVASEFKAAEYGFARVEFYKGASGATYVIDLATGTISGATGWSVAPVAEQLANGFWRVRAGLIADGTAGVFYIYPAPTSSATSWLGDGTSGIYVGETQIELGAGATSQITSGASLVTRASDSLTLGGGAWLNPAGLTALIEFDVAEIAASPSNPIYFSNGTHAATIRVGTGAGGIDFYTFDGATQIDSGAFAVTAGTLIRAAFSLSASGWSFSVNGAAPLTGGASALPVLDRVTLGTNGFNGHIRRAIVYPSALPGRVQALSGSAWG